MIDVLVIRLRVEYFLFGDRHIRELILPQRWLCTQIYRGHSAATMWGQNSTWWFVHD